MLQLLLTDLLLQWVCSCWPVLISVYHTHFLTVVCLPAPAQRAARISTALLLTQQLILAATLLALNRRVVTFFCSDPQVCVDTGV